MDKEKQEAVVDILKHALEVEYQFIIHYPRLAKMMPSEELASKIKLLGQDSVKHADIVSNTISKMGGTAPVPMVAALPEPLDLKDFFQKQLELEKLAFSLHSKAAESVTKELASSFRQIAEQEQLHISITEEIISGLG
jgi:bacterioferritin (cytochrome b1)